MVATTMYVLTLLVSLGDSSAHDEVKLLLARARSSDQITRVEALEKLSSLGPGAAEAVPELCQMLQDASVRNDPFTLSATVQVLAEIGVKAKPAIPLLQRIVKDRKVDSASQGAAMMAIDRIWLTDPDPELRLHGAHGLGQSSPVALPALRRALADPDPRVRDAVQTAIKALEALSK